MGGLGGGVNEERMKGKSDSDGKGNEREIAEWEHKRMG